MDDALNLLRLSAGTVLFKEDGPGDCAYWIKAGVVEIFVERAGKTIVLAHRAAGEIIGEMALIDSGTRSASARTLSDCELVLVTAQQIQHRIAQTDPILRMCLSVVIERYRETLALYAAGTVSDVTSKVAEPITAEKYNTAIAMLTFEQEIARALQRGEFQLYFQPIVDLQTRGLAGFEALVRWNHPTRGIVQPGEFIPVAEASGLISGITLWCLKEVGKIFPILAAKSRQRHSTAVSRDLFISVNISGHDLLDPIFDRTVKTILDDCGISARSLKLEITEGVLMKDPEGAGLILQACRLHGMGIAIDDFGTGYSSLSYLSTLPITTLKIDRAFVQSIAQEGPSRKIVRTIRHLARELEIPVVAEGIETEAQAEAMVAMQCEYGQGYLFGRPAPLTPTLDLIAAWSASTRVVHQSRHRLDACA